MSIKRIDPLKTGFYQVEYIYQDRTLFACYFQLQSAQEAMMKMIARGVDVKGMSEYKPKLEIMSIKRTVQ